MTCRACAAYAPPPIQDVVNSNVAGVPGAVLLWIGVALLITFLLSATTFGRRVYAIGNNPTAAFLAGINVRVVTVALYMLSGLFAALAGIVLVAYGGQATLGMGDPYLFQSIAAAVIGGVWILGGRGHYLGSLPARSRSSRSSACYWPRTCRTGTRASSTASTILFVLVIFGREEPTCIPNAPAAPVAQGSRVRCAIRRTWCRAGETIQRSEDIAASTYAE